MPSASAPRAARPRGGPSPAPSRILTLAPRPPALPLPPPEDLDDDIEVTLLDHGGDADVLAEELELAPAGGDVRSWEKVEVRDGLWGAVGQQGAGDAPEADPHGMVVDEEANVGVARRTVARPPVAFPEALHSFMYAEVPTVVAEVVGVDGVLAEGGGEHDTHNEGVGAGLLGVIEVPVVKVGTAAETFHAVWISLWRVSRALLSNSAPQSVADLLKQLFAKFGLMKLYAAPYRPRGNSIFEAYMRALKSTLRLCLPLQAGPACGPSRRRPRLRSIPNSVSTAPTSCLRAHQRIEKSDLRALKGNPHHFLPGPHVAPCLHNKERQEGGKYSPIFRRPFIVTRVSPCGLSETLWDPLTGENNLLTGASSSPSANTRTRETLHPGCLRQLFRDGSSRGRHGAIAPWWGPAPRGCGGGAAHEL
ncbi:hypothetical protein ACSSS7_008390 [Eimeria intestinalis]